MAKILNNIHISEILQNQVISIKLHQICQNNVVDINILQNQVKIFKLR